MKKIIWLSLCALLSLTAPAQTVEQADSLHQRGRALLSEGQIAEGRALTRQALEMRRQLLGEVSKPYITSLNNLAMSYFMEKDYAQARDLQEQVVALCQRLSPPHPDRGTYLFNMGRFCYFAGDKPRAATMLEQALPLVEKHSEGYELVLQMLGLVYDDLGDTQGTERVMALMLEHNKKELEKPCNEPRCMLERAQYYDVSGDQSMARECFIKVLAMPMDDATKAQVHEAYARFVSGSARDFATAAEYFRSAAQLRKAKEGENEAWAQLTYRAATSAFLAQDYAQASDTYRQTADYYARQTTPQARTNWALCTKGLGNAYSGMKQYAQARDCFRLLVGHYEQHDTASAEYPRAILRMAKAEKYGKEYDPSIAHHKQAMAIFSRRGMTDDYADAASSLQFCYAYAHIRDSIDHRYDQVRQLRRQRLDTIIVSEKSRLDITRKYLSRLIYANSLGVIAGSYAMQQRYDSCLAYYQPYIAAMREAVRDEFRVQTERERMLVWNNVKDHVAEITDLIAELNDGQVSGRHEASASDRHEASHYIALLAPLSYDAQLLSKGILLNSAIEFSRVLQAQGDPQLAAAYAQLKANDDELSRLRQHTPDAADTERILQLTQHSQALQLQLSRGCAEYADFTSYIAYSWRDVQQKLGPSDVAIEFAVTSKTMLRSDQRLVALVLTRDMAAPQAVVVCDGEQLQQMETDARLFDTPQAARTIWGPLMPWLKDRQRLFFSADGSLHRIGIEYLPVDGRPLSEQMEVYRLSSTKVLCYRQPQQQPLSAALFGAIDYGRTEHLSADERSALMALRGSKRGFAPLEKTRAEVDTIGAMLRTAGMTAVETFTGAKASREAFTALSDTRIGLLHISTHGDYKEEHGQTDSESMSRSLLAFAGANSGADGLVTAADIARMNLRHCQLAVLSACQTALGQMGDDGVFGLQRGFKNAGVATLLMSLKPVYDEHTAMLMAAFYRHMLGGCSKREALVRAQQELRQQGHTDARYWAVFILLDAL